MIRSQFICFALPLAHLYYFFDRLVDMTHNLINEESEQYDVQYRHQLGKAYISEKIQCEENNGNTDELLEALNIFQNSQQNIQNSQDIVDSLVQSSEEVYNSQNFKKSNKQKKKSKMQIHQLQEQTTVNTKRLNASDLQLHDLEDLRRYKGNIISGDHKRSAYNLVPQSAITAYSSGKHRKKVKSLHRRLGMTDKESEEAISYFRKQKNTMISLGYFYRLVNYKEGPPQERIYKAAFLEFFWWYVHSHYLIELFQQNQKKKNIDPDQFWKKVSLYIATAKLLINLPDLTENGIKKLEAQKSDSGDKKSKKRSRRKNIAEDQAEPIKKETVVQEYPKEESNGMDIEQT